MGGSKVTCFGRGGEGEGRREKGEWERVRGGVGIDGGRVGVGVRGGIWASWEVVVIGEEDELEMESWSAVSCYAATRATRDGEHPLRFRRRGPPNSGAKVCQTPS